MDKKQSKVKVAIRVRPTLKGNEKTCVEVDKNLVEIFNHRNVNENIQYEFSAVYDGNSTQQQVFEGCVEPLMPRVLEGQNVSVFAYGPTGAGKTHTMLGVPQDPGVIPRVINKIFKLIEAEQNKSDEWKYKVSFSYLEIYNEKVQDLLDPSHMDLPIREDAEKNILVPGLAKKEIHNFEEFRQAFGPASNNRTTAATKLNNRSSRSHSIVQLTVTKMKPTLHLHGKMYLIDLAGSEDNRRTGNSGIRLKESGAINKSLFALGEVVDAINSSLPRIPYRNSKLTRLLQDSVGGSCHSVMITNIAPEERYYYDTYCTLNFATKSKKIVNSTCIRETIVKKTRKTPPCPSLPEEENQIKRQKMTESVEGAVPAHSSDPAPFLSPLLRRQVKLEESVHLRMENLEKKLLEQMKTINSSRSVPLTPRSLGITSLQQQVQDTQAQIIEIVNFHHKPPADSTQLKADEKTDKAPVLADCTNKSPPKKSLMKVRLFKKKEEFTCSPLFAPSKRIMKKGFASNASSGSLKAKDTSSSTTTSEKKPPVLNPVTDMTSYNPELQKKRYENFLELINTSSVKDIQALQTVGAKRAKLIFDWRETYGKYSQWEDLKKIPGFTEKFLQKLLQSNLITVT